MFVVATIANKRLYREVSSFRFFFFTPQCKHNKAAMMAAYDSNSTRNSSSYQFDLDADFKYLNELIKEYTAMKNNQTKVVRVEDFLNDDDFYFVRQPPISSEFFPISVLILTIICMVRPLFQLLLLLLIYFTISHFKYIEYIICEIEIFILIEVPSVFKVSIF